MLILDCGCGDGKYAKSLFPNDEIIGVDITRGVDLNRTLPFIDNRFDIVLANHIIEHLTEPDLFLAEAKRVLRPDGLLILNTPNLACWYNRIILLLGYQPHYTEVSTQYNFGKLYCGVLPKGKTESISGHLRLYTYPALKELLVKSGFKIIQGESVYSEVIITYPIAGLFERLFHKTKGLCSVLSFKCRKESE